MHFLLLVLLSVLGLFPAFIAYQKGHSFALWWLYGAALLVIALPHSLIVQGKTSDADEAVSLCAKVCPYCHESMGQEDNICPACHLRLYDPALDGPAIVAGG